MKKHIIYITSLLFSLQIVCHSQNTVKSLLFDKSVITDSLKGFEIEAATKSLISENYSGEEIIAKLCLLKRQYINDKFKLLSKINYEPIKPDSYQFKQNSNSGNEDFEASSAGIITSSTQIAGWVVTRGSHTIIPSGNSCNLAPTLQNPIESELIDAPNGIIDPSTGKRIYSVFGGSLNLNTGGRGNKFIRINDNGPNYSIEKASKSIIVSANDTVFCFAYAPIILSGHTCCSSGAFLFKLFNLTDNILVSAESHSFVMPSNACNYLLPCIYTSSAANSYFVFKSINLKPYVGKILQFDFIATDCDAGGHYGYAYLDAAINPNLSRDNSVVVNGISIPIKNDTTIIESCDVPARIWLDNNFIKWSEQGITNSTNYFTNPLQSSIYGLYKVESMNEFCVYKNYYLDITFFNAPTTVVCQPVSCKGDLVVMGVSGASNFKWSTGDTTANIAITPSISATYTVSSTDRFNCNGTTFINQIVNECVGIEKWSINESDFSVFPNPTDEFINVKLLKNVTDTEITLEIINAFGNLVYREVFQTSNLVNRINLKNFPAGDYFLRISNVSEHNIRWIKKFVITR